MPWWAHGSHKPVARGPIPRPATMTFRQDPVYFGVDFANMDAVKPDWPTMRAAGVRFAIFRATYAQWTDLTWRDQCDRARAAGVIPAPYLFPVCDDAHPTPEKQVQIFRNYVGPLGAGNFPPTYDCEFSGGIKRTGKTRKELLGWALRAVSEMRLQFGVSPMFYTSERVMDGEDEDSLDADMSDLDLSGFADCPPWLARYPWASGIAPQVDSFTNLPWPPVPKVFGDKDNVWIHQAQGDSVGLAGTGGGTVDLDRFHYLSVGAKGARVKWVQRRIGLAETGDFDLTMVAKVREFQAARGLAADAVIGPATFSHLAWVIH